MYGVLATLCRSTKRQLRIVSPRAMLLLLFTDKECGDIYMDLVKDRSTIAAYIKSRFSRNIILRNICIRTPIIFEA